MAFKGFTTQWSTLLVSLRPPRRAGGGLQVHRYVIITCQGMGDYGVLWRVQPEGVFVQFWDSFTVGRAQHRGGGVLGRGVDDEFKLWFRGRGSFITPLHHNTPLFS